MTVSERPARRRRDSARPGRRGTARARALAVGALAVGAVGAGAAWWWRRAPAAVEGSGGRGPVAVDVPAARRGLDDRVTRARALPTDRQRPRRPEPAGSDAATGNARDGWPWDLRGKKTMPGLVTMVFEPGCWLGPVALCQALAPMIRACDRGDRDDCLAIGQYLADEPPRLLVARSFFDQACRLGVDEACERLARTLADDPTPCADDPFACSVRALRTGDLALHEDACRLGAAESCVMLGVLRADAAGQKAGFVAACQLGSSMACGGLAHALDPACQPSKDQACFPPDEVTARAALELACAGGWTMGLTCPP